MAEAKKRKTADLVYIDIGKVKFRNDDGTPRDEQEYLIVYEEEARFMRATYKKEAPKPITIVTKKGKTYTKEISGSRGGNKFRFGYVDKIIAVGKRKKTKLKWVTFYIPSGAKLSSYIEAAIKKIGNKPIRLMTPSKKSCQLLSVK